MNRALRLLLLEDNPADVGLIRNELNEAGFSFEMKHVFTKLDFMRDLEDFLPDVILADYTIPGFNGMEALSLVKELAPTLPFIVVTGTIDEFTAVECMKAGAVDYVLKDNLKRIVPAIQNGIEKKRVNAEKLLIEEKLKFAVNILENIRDSIIVTNTEGKILYWNKGASILFGYSTEEMLGNSIKEIYPEQDSCQYENERKSLIEKKEYVGEWKGLKKNGEIVWVNLKTCLLHDNNDKMIGILGVSKDITEMKNFQDSLKISQLKANLFLDSIPDLLIRIDKDLRVLDIKTPKGLNLFNDIEVLYGKNLTELPKIYGFITKELVYQFSDYITQALKTGKPQIFDYKFIINNNILHIEIRINVSCQDEVLVMMRDITGNNKQVKNSNLITEYTLIHTIEGKIINANEEMVKLLGYSSLNNLKNETQIQNILTDEKIREELLSDLIINKKVSNLDVFFRDKSGQLIPLILDASLIKDKVTKIVYFELNLKEKIQDFAEMQMKKLQKLEAINTFGSGIVYDFNNIISALSMNIYITEQELPELHPVREHLNNIKNIFQQASDLTGRILNFNSILKD